MEIKSKFGIESAAHYLWAGFEKKLESLDSVGVVPQRVEAFDVSGLCTLGRNFGSHVIGSGQMAATTAGRVIFFEGGLFSFPFLSCFFLGCSGFFSFSFCDYY